MPQLAGQGAEDGGDQAAGKGSGGGTGEGKGTGKNVGDESTAATGKPDGASPATDKTADTTGASGTPDNAPPAVGAAPSTDPAAQTAPPPPPEADFMQLSKLTLSPTRAGAGSPSAAGGAAAPSFLGSQGKGTRFIYVVDRSGSMGGDRFVAACGELKKSLNSLRGNMGFHVIFYETGFEEMPGEPLLPVTRDNISKATAWIDGLQVRGGTNPKEAMLRAIELKPDTIWLLSDGSFSESVCEIIAQANSDQRVRINTIAFHESSGEAVLKRIATENKGDYRFVPPPGGSALGRSRGNRPSPPPNTPPAWDQLFPKKKP